MYKDAVHRAFEDMFRYLGVEITYQPQDAASFPLIGVLKNPESVFDIGTNETVGQVIAITLKSSDVTPKIGDRIVLDFKTYKIYREPLLSGYDYIWKVEGVLIS